MDRDRPEHDFWDLFEVVDSDGNPARVDEFILRVCRELARSGDPELRQVLAVGEAAAGGSKSWFWRQVQSWKALPARMRSRADELQSRLSERDNAALHCIRYTLPNGQYRDPYEHLWQFAHDAEEAGLSSAFLGSVLADVFPEAVEELRRRATEQ